MAASRRAAFLLRRRTTHRCHSWLAWAIRRLVAGGKQDDCVARRDNGAVLVLDPDIRMHLAAALLLNLSAHLAFDPVVIASVDKFMVLA